MAQRDLRAAKRYATALFNVAARDKKLDAVEKDLDLFIGFVHGNPELRSAWESPLLPHERKNAVVDRILSASADPLTISFLKLLVDKGREEVLETARLDLRTLADAERKLVRAEAIFAVEPTKAEQTALAKSLQERTGDRVELTYRVDPSILGGVVVRMRDTILDGSVRGTLERLRDRLLLEV